MKASGTKKKRTNASDWLAKHKPKLRMKANPSMTGRFMPTGGTKRHLRLSTECFIRKELENYQKSMAALVKECQRIKREHRKSPLGYDLCVVQAAMIQEKLIPDVRLKRKKG